MNDSPLFPSPVSLPPAPRVLRDARHPHLVALVCIFGLIPALTVVAIVVEAISLQYGAALSIALIPAVFVVWHLLLAYGIRRGWPWTRSVAVAWVGLSFPATGVAAAALFATSEPRGAGVGAALAALLIVAAAVALAARR